MVVTGGCDDEPESLDGGQVVQSKGSSGRESQEEALTPVFRSLLERLILGGRINLCSNNNITQVKEKGKVQ